MVDIESSQQPPKPNEKDQPPNDSKGSPRLTLPSTMLADGAKGGDSCPAGQKMDEAIANYVRRTYNLYIGDRTAEEAKFEVGSAYPLEHERTMEVRGRDLINGLPRSATITSAEIREAIAEPVNAIVEAVRICLERTPPELAADIVDKGIVLAGGGALLRNLDVLLREETGLPVVTAEDPLSCVVLGSGKVLDELNLLRRVAVSS